MQIDTVVSSAENSCNNSGTYLIFFYMHIDFLILSKIRKKKSILKFEKRKTSILLMVILANMDLLSCNILYVNKT